MQVQTIHKVYCRCSEVCYLPITVRLTKEFRVGEPWKSTRHLYEPASVSRTFSTARCVPAGWSVSVTRKKARPPRACSSAQCVAWSRERPRASRLQSRNSPNVTLQCNMYYSNRFVPYTEPLWCFICMYWFQYHLYCFRGVGDFRKLQTHSQC
jgi:hypothetical protein